MYKSYADAMIMHFISYLKDVEPSFIFGNYEEIPKIDFILKLTKGVGVLLLRRFPQNHVINDLSAQEIDAINYVNQSLLDEVVQGNKMTTFFQNDKRNRTGKFCLPNQADMSIKMILRTHAKLQKLKYNIKIVPVCINHERLFEASHLANEMISGEFQDVSFIELLYNIFS